MYTTTVAGLNISTLTKQELLQELERRLKTHEKTFITTPYSEFLYHALREPSLLNTLNKADFAVPDGIGIFWAAKFLALPLTASRYSSKTMQACWQAAYTLLTLLVSPRSAYRGSRLKEKIPGSEFVWDVAHLAAKNRWSVYLLGGYDDTPKLVADKLISRSAGKLTVAGYSNKNPNDPSVIDDITRANPDMLIVAYGPLKQEQWIAEHMVQLPARLYIGLGGTFDYLAGKQPIPPSLLRQLGLEWFWRLVTQPRRIRRIWHATAGLISTVVRYKIQETLEYRRNVVSVILNQHNEVFVGLRKPDGKPRNDEHWMLPQGGLEADEDVVSGAKREIYEETGMRSVVHRFTSPSTYRYEWPLGFSRHFKGQQQSIAYFTFEGQDNEINLNNHPVVEFVQYAWVPLATLKEKLHPLRQPLADIVLQDLSQAFRD